MKQLRDKIDYETYNSAFTLRYGSLEMRKIWSEKNKRQLWRKIWLALAKAQAKYGIVSEKELQDLLLNEEKIDILKSREFEKEIYHETMAEIKTFASQAVIGGGKIHLGATSADILDNATILQVNNSFEIIENKLLKLLKGFAVKIEKYQDLVCMGYTHLQPAEPTTLGYRFSFYAQDLLTDLRFMRQVGTFIKGKGFKGAVGTSASYVKLLGKKQSIDAFEFEKEILKDLGIEAVFISSQTYPRKIDWLITTIFSSLAQSLHKFCFDFRILASPLFGEWQEKTDLKRVGSSAMPFKKNPDKAEKVCSLARFISSLPEIAWNNSANSLLERTLDDSANQRIFLPEGFLALDECLETTINLLLNLEIKENGILNNLNKYADFSSTESFLMAIVSKGANRQDAHEAIKQYSLQAWDDIAKGKENPLKTLILKDKIFLSFLSEAEILSHFNVINHTGLAKQRTKIFLEELKSAFL